MLAGYRVQPDPVLCGQVLLLVICGLRTEDALVKPSHDVLLHLVHNWFHGLQGAWRRAHAGQRRLAGCSSDVLDCRRGLTPTFEVTHQAVGHVLVEILDTLGQFVCAQVLKGSKVGQSSPGLQTINRSFLSRTTDLLARHVHEKSSAVLVDLPARFLEVLQEFHKVLCYLVCFKAGVATNGRTGSPPL